MLVLPRTYCINLDREPEKYEKVCREFGNTLDIVRVPAIDGQKTGITGIEALFNTNINLFNSILDNEEYTLPYLIVIEDDIYKHVHFHEFWIKILDFINGEFIWDFISLDFFLLNEDSPELEVYNEFLYTTTKSRMTGFMIYNIDFLRDNIDYLSSCNILDMTMKHNVDFIQLIPKELIVKQYVDKVSNTANRETPDYNQYYNRTEAFIKDYEIVSTKR
jgi:GR25 family glycosyltransferase involved in LPS biosynthesis